MKKTRTLIVLGMAAAFIVAFTSQGWCSDHPKSDHPTTVTPKPEHPSIEHPKADAPKVEHPNVEHPNAETPKVEHPNAEHPKAEHPTEHPR